MVKICSLPVIVMLLFLCSGCTNARLQQQEIDETKLALNKYGEVLAERDDGRRKLVKIREESDKIKRNIATMKVDISANNERLTELRKTADDLDAAIRLYVEELDKYTKSRATSLNINKPSCFEKVVNDSDGVFDSLVSLGGMISAILPLPPQVRAVVGFISLLKTATRTLRLINNNSYTEYRLC